MDLVFEKFDVLWNKSLVDPSDKNANSQFFQKARIDSGMFQDMVDLLKEEFYNSKHNIFEMHLYLIERSLNNKECPYKIASAAFINQAFIEYHNQVKNASKRNTKTTEPAVENKCNNLTSNCQIDADICNCEKRQQSVLKAFEVACGKNMPMLGSLNKVYKFTAHLDYLRPTILTYMDKINFSDQALLVGELQIQESFSMEKIVIPLMLIDKYTSIDDYIKGNETVLIQVVELCERLCDPSVKLKELAMSYENVQRKKVDKFKTKIIARYASSCLKRIKRSSLIASKYKNIAIQLKVTQMRFLINLRYDKWGSDPISFEAWIELILDLVGDDEFLQNKLLLELMQYKKDIEVANKFLDIFGYDKNLNKLPDSLKEFFLNNIEFIKADSKEDSTEPQPAKKFHYPTEFLNESKIKFIECPESFVDMLNYFEEAKPKVIGLDCEWKPTFDLVDVSNENEKRNFASTLQISSKERSFVIDVKFLIDRLSEDVVNRFGELILFNESLMKFGYSFQQDSKKLALSFPSFKHKFTEFEDDVINIDEIVTEFQKNWNLFPHLTSEVVPKDKKQRSAKGLSELTRKCFGAPLNKSECLSNWDKRPLRQAQLNYAALDAFVLLQIHEFIQARCKDLNVEFDYASSKKNIF